MFVLLYLMYVYKIYKCIYAYVLPYRRNGVDPATQHLCRANLKNNDPTTNETKIPSDIQHDYNEMIRGVTAIESMISSTNNHKYYCYQVWYFTLDRQNLHSEYIAAPLKVYNVVPVMPTRINFRLR